MLATPAKARMKCKAHAWMECMAQTPERADCFLDDPKIGNKTPISEANGTASSPARRFWWRTECVVCASAGT